MIAPTVRTEARMLYDDDYLYVAFNNFDPNPEKIMVRRTRRDDWRTGFDFNADWVGIGIDSRNDDKTGYWFAVNAAEVQVDVAITGDGYGGFDGTWNAVWESKVAFHNDGWAAEIKIPFNVFNIVSLIFKSGELLYKEVIIATKKKYTGLDAPRAFVVLYLILVY